MKPDKKKDKIKKEVFKFCRTFYKKYGKMMSKLATE
jgi:hypothetical protein